MIYHGIKKIINDFLERQKQFSSLESTNPIIPVKELIKQGWEPTSEGLDFMQTTKLDGEVEILRHQFLDWEFRDMTMESIEQNRRRHLKVVEQSIISDLEYFIVSKYEKIQVNSIDLEGIEELQDLKRYRDKVLKYNFNKKAGLINESTDLLDCSFREMKPISEVTVTPLMQKSFNHNIESYLDMIPKNLTYTKDPDKDDKVIDEMIKDEKYNKYFHRYLEIRDISADEQFRKSQKQNNVSISKRLLDDFIKEIDSGKEAENENNRKELLSKARRDLGIGDKDNNEGKNRHTAVEPVL